MTEPTQERLDNSSDIEHGLTQAQILELFGDQGDFPDDPGHEEAMAVLTRKATLAAEWLSSFWTSPLPDWLIEARAQGKLKWDAALKASPVLKNWLESFETWEHEQGIENPNPLHHLVHEYFRTVRAYGKEAEYDRDQEVVLKLLVDAGNTSDPEIKRRLEYAKTVLETEGEATILSGFSKSGFLPPFEFPKPLL